ncbi:unnamed protein product, partial [Ectocarpus fasciculatus]
GGARKRVSKNREPNPGRNEPQELQQDAVLYAHQRVRGRAGQAGQVHERAGEEIAKGRGKRDGGPAAHDRGQVGRPRRQGLRRRQQLEQEQQHQQEEQQADELEEGENNPAAAARALPRLYRFDSREPVAEPLGDLRGGIP